MAYFQGTSTYSSGKCPHSLCVTCVDDNTSSTCPVATCDVPTYRKDFQVVMLNFDCHYQAM